jgi:hypothetical protein
METEGVVTTSDGLPENQQDTSTSQNENPVSDIKNSNKGCTTGQRIKTVQVWSSYLLSQARMLDLKTTCIGPSVSQSPTKLSLPDIPFSLDFVR